MKRSWSSSSSDEQGGRGGGGGGVAGGGADALAVSALSVLAREVRPCPRALWGLTKALEAAAPRGIALHAGVPWAVLRRWTGGACGGSGKKAREEDAQGGELEQQGPSSKDAQQTAPLRFPLRSVLLGAPEGEASLRPRLRRRRRPAAAAVGDAAAGEGGGSGSSGDLSAAVLDTDDSIISATLPHLPPFSELRVGTHVDVRLWEEEEGLLEGGKASLEAIVYEQWNTSNKALNLPSAAFPKLQVLRFGGSFDTPLLCLPASLTDLDVGFCYNQALPHPLPAVLKRLILGHDFDQPLGGAGLLREGLEEVKFSWQFDQCVSGNLPTSLVNVFFDENFSQPLPSLVEHVKLQSLTLGEPFNHPLELPPNLVVLKLGHYFNQPLHLPASLKHLRLSCHYNQPTHLPEGIEVVSFGERFNQPLQHPLPASLRRITVGDCFSQPLTLPQHCEEANFGFAFGRSALFLDCEPPPPVPTALRPLGPLPVSLRKLTLGPLFRQALFLPRPGGPDAHPLTVDVGEPFRSEVRRGRTLLLRERAVAGEQQQQEKKQPGAVGDAGDAAAAAAGIRPPTEGGEGRLFAGYEDVGALCQWEAGWEEQQLWTGQAFEAFQMVTLRLP